MTYYLNARINGKDILAKWSERMDQTKLSEKTLQAVRAALSDGYYEGAVEAVFEQFPEATRDEVVDVVEKMATQQCNSKWSVIEFRLSATGASSSTNLQ